MKNRSSWTSLIARYQQESETERSVVALRKAFDRGYDQRLVWEIYKLWLRENKHEVKRSFDEITQIYKANEELFDEVLIPAALLSIAFIGLIIIHNIECTEDHLASPVSPASLLSQEIKDVLKEKGYKITTFAEWLYMEDEDNLEDKEQVIQDSEERKVALRKYTEKVRKHLGRPSTKLDTLQFYLEFAQDLDPIY